MAKFTLEQIEKRALNNLYAQAPLVDDSRYGNPERKKIFGTEVNVGYGNPRDGIKKVSYLVPRDCSETSGVRNIVTQYDFELEDYEPGHGFGSITIDNAFRIFAKYEDGTELLREVKDLSELESVALGYFTRILQSHLGNK